LAAAPIPHSKSTRSSSVQRPASFAMAEFHPVSVGLTMHDVRLRFSPPPRSA
jgi:hypothetical protein